MQVAQKSMIEIPVRDKGNTQDSINENEGVSFDEMTNDENTVTEEEICSTATKLVADVLNNSLQSCYKV